MLVVLVGWLSFWRKVMEAAILEANLRLRPSTFCVRSRSRAYVSGLPQTKWALAIQVRTTTVWKTSLSIRDKMSNPTKDPRWPDLRDRYATGDDNQSCPRPPSILRGQSLDLRRQTPWETDQPTEATIVPPQLSLIIINLCGQPCLSMVFARN